MTTEKKTPPNAGNGRKPGTPNKTTKLLREAIIIAAEQAGGKAGLIGYLTTQAKKNPKAFLTLLGRVLPLQIGSDGPGLIVTVKDYTGRKRESEE